MNALAALLVRDTEKTGIALAANFGDSYLCTHDSAYGSLRRAVLALGYRFESRGPLVDSYRAAPLLALAELMSSRIIPFHENRATIGRLAAGNQTPEPDILTRLVLPNAVLHESAHALADALTAGIADRSARLLLGEALANATELWIAARSGSEMERLYLRFQTHYTVAADVRARLARWAGTCGERTVFRCLATSFFRRSFGLALTGEEAGLLDEAIRHFNPAFVIETNSFYFRHVLGDPRPWNEIATPDLAARAPADPSFFEAVDRYAQALLLA